MTLTRRILIMLAILIVTVTLDQAAKVVARDQLSSTPPVHLLNGAVMLTYTENQGAFLGLGSALPAGVRFYLFIVMTALIVVGMTVVALRIEHVTPTLLAGLTLIVGGGIGNLIDRVLHEGRVVDFMHLEAGPLQTGIFNLADLFLMAGIALTLIVTLRSGALAHPVEKDPQTTVPTEVQMVDSKTVETWVNNYIKAWNSNDPADIASLFAAEATYSIGPFDQPWVGRDQIVANWLAGQDAPGSFSFGFEVLSASGDLGVVRGRTKYFNPDSEFANLWLLRFNDQGQATEFSEWWIKKSSS